MNAKILFGLSIAAVSVIAAPSIAITQNQNSDFCDALNTLRHASVTALFVQFQGEDDLETATALLRQTDINGRLAPSIAVRFDEAAQALAIDSVQHERLASIAHMEASPNSENCENLQDSGLLWANSPL